MGEMMDFAKLGLAVTLNGKLGYFEEAPLVSSLEVLKQRHPDRIIKMIVVGLEQYQVKEILKTIGRIAPAFYSR